MTDTASRLTELPSLYRSLATTILTGTGTANVAAGGRSLPITATAYDFMRFPHQSGHLGLIDLLATLDLVTRAQLAHSEQQFYGTDRELATVESACMYLTAQLPILETTELWTNEAQRLVEDALDQTLSRIDVSTIRVQFDGQVRAAKRQIDAGEYATADDLAALEAVRDADYVDFEGRWFDRITERYLAACSPFGWVAFVKSEIRWAHHQATVILGTALPSTAPVTECPWGCGGLLALHLEHDSAGESVICDSCHRSWDLNDGTAAQHFQAWRDAGWKPQRIPA